jgi:hypothetical protein
VQSGLGHLHSLGLVHVSNARNAPQGIN